MFKNCDNIKNVFFHFYERSIYWIRTVREIKKELQKIKKGE
jgi:hypothetical protein